MADHPVVEWRKLRADQLRDRRAAEQGRDAQLVAAGEEDAAGLLDALPAVFLARVAARVEIERADAAGAEFGEDLLVALAGIGELARGRYDDDVGIGAAAQVDEPLEDARVVLFFLGAADRNDPAALAAVADLAGTHAAETLVCL